MSPTVIDFKDINNKNNNDYQCENSDVARSASCIGDSLATYE